MEQYNYIKAKVISNDKITDVRQVEAGGRMWTDKDGEVYSFVDLDFTQNLYGLPDFIKELEEHNKSWDEQNKKHQETMDKLLNTMDVKAIEERKYWRKLRGDVFLYLIGTGITIQETLNFTDDIINNLYKQDRKLFLEF